MQTSSPRGKVPQAKSGLGGDKEFFTSTSPAQSTTKTDHQNDPIPSNIEIQKTYFTNVAF